MRVTLIVLLVLVSLVHTSHGTFDQFISSIPSKIGNAITSAWYTIVDAIKKPVRMKKLGPGAKPKIKTRAKAVTVDPSLWKTTDATRTSLRVQDLFRRTGKDNEVETYKVTLPHLSIPLKNSIEGRYKYKRTDFVDDKESMKGKYIFPEYYPGPVKQRHVKDRDENNFGHLVFV